MSLPPYEDANPDPYRAPSSAATPVEASSIVRQVPTLGWLLIAHGALVILLGLFLFMAVFGSVLIIDMSPNPQFNPVHMMIGYSVVGSLAVIAGILIIVAGAKLLDFRGRAWALTAIGLSVVSVITCLCAPTAIGIAIYGVVLLLNPQVVEAFRQRRQGRSKIDIMNAVD